jgi:hypothetical protein
VRQNIAGSGHNSGRPRLRQSAIAIASRIPHRVIAHRFKKSRSAVADRDQSLGTCVTDVPTPPWRESGRAIGSAWLLRQLGLNNRQREALGASSPLAMVRRWNPGYVRLLYSRTYWPDNHKRRKRRHSPWLRLPVGMKSLAVEAPDTAGARRGACNYLIRFGKRFEVHMLWRHDPLIEPSGCREAVGTRLFVAAHGRKL